MMFKVCPTYAEQIQHNFLPRANISNHSESAEGSVEIGARTQETAALLETQTINSNKLNGCASAAELEISVKNNIKPTNCEKNKDSKISTSEAEKEEEEQLVEESEQRETKVRQPNGKILEVSGEEADINKTAVRLESGETANSRKKPIPGLAPIPKSLPPLIPIHELFKEQNRQQYNYNLESAANPFNQESSDSAEDSDQDYVMGLSEILKSIFPRFKSENRKRKTEDQNNDLIKYRRVSNIFPKLYTNPVDNDEVAPNYPVRGVREGLPKLLNTRTNNLTNNPFQNFFNIQQQQQQQLQSRTVLGMDKPTTSRKNMCDASRQTQKPFRIPSFTEQEYSDDDDDLELVSGFGVGIGGGAISRQNYGDGACAFRPTPPVINVPIRHEQPQVASKQYVPRPMQAPSLFADKSAALTSQFNSIPRPTYRDVLQMDSNSRVLLGARGISPASTDASSSHSRSRSAVASNRRTNAWGGPMNSVLDVQRRTTDHLEYAKLLGINMPELYGAKPKAAMLESLKDLNRRRGAFFLAKSDAEKGKISSIRGSNAERQIPGFRKPMKAPPLSSTAIDLTDDDDEDDDVKITGFNFLQTKKPMRKPHRSPLKILDNNDGDDDDISIIELSHEISKRKQNKQDDDVEIVDVRSVSPVNTVKEKLMSTVPYIQSSWDSNLQQKWNQRKKERQLEAAETKRVADQLTAQRQSVESDLQERLRNCAISLSKEWIAFEDPTPVVSEEAEFAPLTEEHQKIIRSALSAPPNQTLISKFSQNITRRDIMTLTGLNWLNDEVINFYMNLLMDRSEQKHQSHGLPRVHAMNTFFIPRLLEGGYAGVKRWTRKVDIFSFDIIPVPVHVGNVHWCMAIIHLKNKTIKYYDSMGQPNAKVLNALEMYLKSESEDKRKIPFDTRDFLIESVQDVPRQQNGSDCGVFSCMFAEYVTRNKKITFSQRNMEYFRAKMILEIVQGKLLQ